jgi:hypothetical protein
VRSNFTQGKFQQRRSKKLPHSSILTLDDLDKNKWKNYQLIIQYKARYKADKEPGKDKPNRQKSEDFFELEGDQRYDCRETV